MVSLGVRRSAVFQENGTHGGDSGEPSDTREAWTIRHPAPVIAGLGLLGLGTRRLSIERLALAAAGIELVSFGMTGRHHLASFLPPLPERLNQRLNAGDRSQSFSVQRSITIARPVEEVYAAWKTPETLQRVFEPLLRLTAADDTITRWEVRMPARPGISWETEMIEDRPNELIRWRSLETSRVHSESGVRFRQAPLDWGTELTLTMTITPPGGAFVAAALDRLVLVPNLITADMLYRFRSLVTTGEIPTTEGQPSGRGRTS